MLICEENKATNHYMTGFVEAKCGGPLGLYCWGTRSLYDVTCPECLAALEAEYTWPECVDITHISPTLTAQGFYLVWGIDRGEISGDETAKGSLLKKLSDSINDFLSTRPLFNQISHSESEQASDGCKCGKGDERACRCLKMDCRAK
jgi:hypothetical protein